MRIIRACLFVLFVIGALPSGGQAAERDINPTARTPAAEVAIRGEYWALLIGIDTYQHVESLETAVRDVQAVRDVLVQRYGFAPGRISMLVNAQATRAAIEDTLYEIGQKTKPEDSVLIYYAGHGQTDPEKLRGWWVPVDGKAKSPGTFISNARVRDEMAAMKARHVYLVADSCFSGSLFGRSRAMAPLSDKIVARLYQDRSRWGLTSGMNEPVSDLGKGGHSIFAYFFLKLLRENQDPYLIPLQIYDRLLPLVANNSRQQPRSQPLQDAHDEGGQFVFRLTLHTKVGAAAPLAASPAAEPPKPIQEARLRPEAELPDPRSLRKKQLQDIFDQAMNVMPEYDGCCRDFMFRSIAEKQAKAGDLDGALRTRGYIEKDKDKNDSNLMVALVDAYAKAGKIQEALKQALDLKDTYRWRGLRAVAIAQVMAGNIPDAMKTASMENMEGVILLEVAKQQVKQGEKLRARESIQAALTHMKDGDQEAVKLLVDMGEVSLALQAAAQLRSPRLIYGIFVDSLNYIATAQAKAGHIEQALQTAYRVRDDHRAYVLGSIAAIQAQEGDKFGSMRTFQEAIKLARNVGASEEFGTVFDAETNRGHRLLSVALDQVEAGDVDGAMETVSFITKVEIKIRTLAEIGRKQNKAGDKLGATRTFAQALNIAEGILDEYKREDALENLAVRQAFAGDFTGALMTVNHPAVRVSNRISTYGWIAEIKSKAGDLQGALDLVNSQKKPDDKLKVLLRAADGLLSEENWR